ncbi:MAG TPA: fumarylacetoacetate hydrolase family protein [Bacteroidales bacterium]|nr:fumarylacetoacetate hydrolase family protein [Bacteroidales bacterium]HRZ47829.1 fumarylacetoacetate hydrolase family protein [Bacteroidales bacterium]
MKIICIGQNYREHNREMQSAEPTEPVFFLKPDTSILIRNRPFYYPGFTEELHYEAEIVVKINKVGRHIQPKFAHTYYHEVAFGLDLTARDLQRRCKANGHPWEISKGFEGSAPISRFISLQESGFEIQNIPFSLAKNGVVVQEGNTSDMIFAVNEIIAYVSTYFTLKTGDMIFTGTPSGVGPLAIGDQLEGFIGQQKMLSMEIR